jgi:K+-transporting ATPase ATPase A chain
VLLAVMVVLFAGGLALCDFAEAATPPQLAALHVSGGNMEGKETRFGIGGSVLAAVVTSNGATGSYNSMHDSYQPLGVLVPLVNMLLGEVVFGGLGTGLYGMIMIALVAVLYALLTSKVVLVLTALALAMSAGRAGLVTNGGARGFTEVLFAYASSMANNGQSMAGLNPNNVFFNITTAIAMLAGRFGLAALALALAGRFAAQRRWPTTVGTLPSDSVMFAILVFGTIVLVGALGFLPALALGPLAEALQR